MFDHKLDAKTPKIVILEWLVLSFLSGNVNAGGFLACGKFVSHVTGFATLFGIDAAEGRWDAAFGILSVPVFFLLGVMIAAYLVERPKHKKGRPHYATVMSLVCACLLVGALGGHWRWFGEFSQDTPLRYNYILLALLCLASGLQNAAITTASGHTVRTTHLTGISTDLGIGIIRAFSMAKQSSEYKWETAAARLRAGTIGAFAMGSAVGAFLFFKAQFLGFLLPAGIAALAILHELRPKQNSRS